MAAGGPRHAAGAVELWFDVRSRSRELVPEMLGAIAVASVVAIAVLADGGEPSLAYALWLVLAARVVASIPHVRALIKRLHARSHTGVDVQACDDTGCPPTTRNWTTAGLLAATAAVGLSPQAVGGTAAVITLGVVQEVIARQPPRPAKIVGIQQTALGMAVVLATAAGVWFS